MTTKPSSNWIRGKRLARAAVVLLVLSCGVVAARDSSDKNAQSAENNTVYEPGNGLTPPKGVYTPNPEYRKKPARKKSRAQSWSRWS